MAAKKSPALEFTRRYLRDKPEATFAEIRDAAAEEDLKIYPIVFGRAKALEGLVEVAPYGSRKKAREDRQKEQEAGAEAAGAEAEPAESAAESAAEPVGAPPKTGSVEQMIASLRESHAERARYREALLEISRILDELL